MEFAMQSTVFATAAKGCSVLVSETEVERLQLVGRVGPSTFLMGGSRDADGMTSGPNPYDLMSASLAACTVMTIRLFAERRKIVLGRIQVGVVHRRGSGGARDVFERAIILDENVSEKHREAMIAVANLCPVGKTLGRGADIRTVVNPAEGRPAASSASDYVEDVRKLEIPNVDW
jgi:putative redox protein